MKWNDLGAWSALLADQKDLFSELNERLALARQEAEIYPPDGSELTALKLTQPDAVCAVILGQDPYHEPGQAFGLAFAVKKGVPLPPSLRNIYTELQSDLGVASPNHGDLTAWAERGVLLLNTVLSVERGRANSHAAWGWQRLTDAVIAATNRLPQPIAFVLWGAQAQKKAALIQSCAPRLVLSAPHPSPLSSYRGFFGSKPFSQINRFLKENGDAAIKWQI
ncbi:MAG: uracil-DNA glycosylase [Oscillospiraceae bacterium]|nr:uracil-DNA glycosylase [Oscillospiraceae bacterium]